MEWICIKGNVTGGCGLRCEVLSPDKSNITHVYCKEDVYMIQQP